MEPSLSEGDLIHVNYVGKEIRTGRIYLLRIDDELLANRLENRPGGVLTIRSDNKDYDDLSVNLSKVDGDIEIFGYIVWSCREH